MKKILTMLVLFSCFGGALGSGVKEGVLVYEYGDSFLATGENHLRYHLQTEAGIYPLSLSEAFENRTPIRAWEGKRVAVTFKSDEISLIEPNSIQVVELLAGESVRAAVTGVQPWVSILCKFNDVAVEPKNQSFFQNMYASLPAGLDHYWREVSYDAINIVGSKAIDWVDLPRTQLEYIPTVGSGDDADLNLLFDDCTEAADPFVNYATGANGSSFVGINMMFNHNLDCCAWGGGRFKTLDGLSKSWRTTWNPPWSFANEGVIAHEMGHGFGLPHANNSDGDSNPYDSPWDVMSAATSNYSVNDSEYGRLGNHTSMYHKYQLGWVDDADGFTTSAGITVIKTINWTALTTTANEKYVRIPLSDGTSYFIEARQESGQYESNIVDTAVIIHHVSASRQEPAWVVDGDNPVADYANTEGVMWKPGEIFSDPIDGYMVEVIEQVADGYRVRIIGPDDLIFRDGFQSLVK